MNKKEIENILPNRDPYLFLDEVLVEGDSARGYKKLTGEEYFFEGHFPGLPVMPGVLIVESIAQTARILVSKGDLKLKSLENIKFRNTIEPGDTVEIVVRKEKSVSENEYRFFGEVFVKENKSASGYITLGIN